MGITIVHRHHLMLFLVMLGVIFAEGISSQSFRGEVTNRESITSDTRVESQLSAGDVVLFHIDPTFLRFIEALEITIEPQEQAVAPGSFSVAVFGAVDPPAAQGVQNLAGQRLETLPLTDPEGHRLFLPLDEDYSRAQGTTTRPADPRIGDIALQLVPIMKGMDNEALSTTYSVRISPRLRPIGALRVSLAGEAELLSRTREELQLTLNGEEIGEDTVVERTPGIYRLEAQAGDFLETTTNVGIEQGHIREITLEPREPLAMIRVSVPTVAEVYWNGTRLVDQRPFTAAPGEYSIMIRLGDFTVSRRVELEAHEEYELGIDLDILLKRN
ncbi:MAG: hypothetical protein ACOCU4_03820 [Alkalispirochaeta sp.]